MIGMPPYTPTIAYDELRHKLESCLGEADESHLFTVITNAPFEYQLEMAFLFLGFMTLYLVDQKAGVIRLAAASDTEYYQSAITDYPTYDEATFELPLAYDDNSIVRAITSGKPQDTSDWATLRRPDVASKFPRANQANSGIAHNAVYPLDIPGGGGMMFSYYQYQQDVGRPQKEFMEQYTKLVSAVLKQRLAA